MLEVVVGVVGVLGLVAAYLVYERISALRVEMAAQAWRLDSMQRTLTSYADLVKTAVASAIEASSLAVAAQIAKQDPIVAGRQFVMNEADLRQQRAAPVFPEKGDIPERENDPNEENVAVGQAPPNTVEVDDLTSFFGELPIQRTPVNE